MTFELCVFDLTHKELLEKAFLEYLLRLVPSCYTCHLNPSSCYSACWNFSKVSGKYQGKAKKAGKAKKEEAVSPSRFYPSLCSSTTSTGLQTARELSVS